MLNIVIKKSKKNSSEEIAEKLKSGKFSWFTVEAIDEKLCAAAVSTKRLKELKYKITSHEEIIDDLNNKKINNDSYVREILQFF